MTKRDVELNLKHAETLAVLSLFMSKGCVAFCYGKLTYIKDIDL